MEENKQLNIKAIHLVIKDTMHEAILGTYGALETDAMMFKMHTAIDMANKLQISELSITVTLRELTRAKKEYEKLPRLDNDS